MEQTKREQHDVITGRNAVLESLKSERELDTIYVAKGERNGSISQIIALAKKKNIVVKEADSRKLDYLSEGSNHQGVVAIPCATSYASVEDILAVAEQKGEDPFLIIADEIEDPHNLGALIRTAEAAGAHGMIIPKRRSASLTPIVYKTSAGAVNYLKVARVTNLASEMEHLKERGIWIYGADMDGQNWCETDFSGGVALVVGSEGKGIGRLVRSKCDAVVSLPMEGQINSLNASVAGGILMYEITRQRLKLQAKNVK
ncbi:23S rRNA (guanosine(2251)-2'-O)-methyltransferase RlmB [Massilioclostridium coli]|uniref:23S rRNA (guanosine(2251)-2'-O)-methyltransferase RlmB n=1 Tax=Massilioclostridium coli TaxID=1870991 RepID=UPI00085CC6ED|nr:23S rRNA (guanosine(2251)-2'-O)-methyltransferase RlmB [Massilioclostridium coli]PWM98250.1 MAG: 23S rRNA (guanosine(2251)-2'-O)-methyltransferase RlmB [Massilioclostridium sp.]PWM98476.1 MAG: 23S rRNA (guanosine(2251)-2'-O)-methyltransferase RlmB [Massilioclostridium sp.]